MSLLLLKVTTRDRLPVPWVLHVYNLVLVNSYTQCWVTSWGLVFHAEIPNLLFLHHLTYPAMQSHWATTAEHCLQPMDLQLLLWLYMMALHHSIFRMVPKSTVVWLKIDMTAPTKTPSTCLGHKWLTWNKVKKNYLENLDKCQLHIGMQRDRFMFLGKNKIIENRPKLYKISLASSQPFLNLIVKMRHI